MKKHFLFTVFIFLCLISKAQYEGDWYVLRTKGLTSYRFEKNRLISAEQADSIGAKPKRIIDTTIISHRIEKNGFVYLIGENNFHMPRFMKTQKVNGKCFIHIQLILPQNTNINFNGAEDLMAYINHDTLPGLPVTAYSHDSILETTYLRPLNVANLYEFDHLLGVMIDKYDALQAFVKEHMDGTRASLLYLLPMARGDIERGSYLQEKFSPFGTKKDFQYLSEKYGSDAKVTKKLEKLKRGK